jgi:AmmeMemoRadiSam system radical SAM enzyme/AmmeMemoRadiSam system protein B/AmmeMemoRadiSam system protein A
MRTIVQPPQSSGDPAFATGWWHDDADTGRIICDLCPRACNMKPGDRGFCFVRQNVDGQMALTTYGKSTGFCIDPIEKKPLNHFYPGTAVLSFGTAGCNLGCKFCQNWDISKSREVERLSQLATPDTIAVAAKATNCRSVAFTYNDPIIWAEYAIDTAEACRREGVKSVAVTAGYISPAARPAFFHAMDAANVDLKAFTEEFYHKITYSHLQPVLDTLRWLKHESDVWFEITNLLIPDANDSPDEVRRMCDWILEAVGADVPVHFTAFHPDFRMTDRGRTPHETLLQAKQIAIEQGIRFAYVGNVNDVKNQSTWCPSCQHLLIERNHYQLGAYHVANGCCANCGQAIAGHFENHPGNWGAKRQPIRISDHAPSNLVTLNTPPTLTSRLPVETPMPENAAVIRNPILTSVQESAIHKLASEIVAAAIHQRSVDSEILDAVNHEGTGAITVMGAFVTLKSNGHLRACCGMVGQPVPLLQAVRHAAARTATEDHRFPPVSPVELRHLTLDVTLLFNFEPLSQQGEARVGAVEAGRHGLKIVRGDKAGLLLPSVAVDAGWDSRTFLNQVCRKAGLPVTAWLEADSQLLRFEGHMIEGTFNDSVLQPREGRPAFDMTQNQVDALCRFAKSNIIAHVQGAIPGCLGADCPDRSVNGIVVRVLLPGDSGGVTFSNFQVRAGLPLQTTLLQLTQSAAQWLQSVEIDLRSITQMAVDCVVFADPAMHGTVGQPAVAGIARGDRAIMVVEGQRRAWAFDHAKTVDELISVTASLAGTRTDTANVYSFEARSSINNISDSNVPQPQAGPNVRPAAVAGTFYPACPVEFSQAVDDCFAACTAPDQIVSAAAVMLPHAGLRFSGRFAADVLNHIKIPDTVIIIGPKHTRAGVDWAVAPHESWQLPGCTVAADVSLAAKLASQIDGLELDAAAHAAEHSTEVILPLLACVAPKVKVVSIAMGGATFEQCQTFASQLAKVIQELPSMPLLIISSDMNHFATDAENRRLDEMALTAMETKDPQRLLDVVTSNNISMCGVIPAVVVMQTLLAMEVIPNMQRVGYGTSADAGGNPDRVVGYAGVILGD